ncbi:MAG: hypothetical protein WA957_00580 [Alteraurantiacibacter sp.]
MGNDKSYHSFVREVEKGSSPKAIGNDAIYKDDYIAISKWFDSQGQWDASSVRLGCLIVYGWMPTIFRSAKTKSFNEVAVCLNNDEIPTRLHNFANNSFVGTSKFLHFWKPHHFAIWDSRICKTLKWGIDANVAAKFGVYQEYCRRYVGEHPEVSFRDVEQALFLRKEAN